MQSGGLILVILGILVVYGAVTGKLDCFLSALATCYSSGADAGATATQTSLSGVPTPALPSFNNPFPMPKGGLETRAGLIFS